MTSRNVLVQNKIGFHARPVSLLVETGKIFKSSITVEKDGQTADIRSIVSLMKLRVKMGDEVVVCAQGEDEADAVRAIVELIESKFGEE